MARRRIPRPAARRLLGAAALAVAALAAPAVAHAGIFPGETIDASGADIGALGDLDLARDGTGAVVYTRTVDGASRVFLSRFSEGAFAPPEPVDDGVPGPGTDPVVAAADGGRLLVAWIGAGTLYVRQRLPGGALLPAQAIADGAAAPSADMSIHGTSYVGFTRAGDVRVARGDRRETSLSLLADPVDIDPARPAGEGPGRARVVVAADGTGLVVWGESAADGRMHLWARRAFEQRLSSVPQDLTLGDLEGTPGGSVTDADVDIEDDSSYAWVVFRQVFGGTGRVVGRRLRGSRFEPPVVLDGGAAGEHPRVAMSGRGEGLSAVGRPGGAREVWASLLLKDAFAPAFRLDAVTNLVDPMPIPAVAENGDGMIAWRQAAPGEAPGIRARLFDVERMSGETGLSRPEEGPVDLAAGFDAASDRAGNALAVFVQGEGTARRVVAGLHDRPPLRSQLYTTQRWLRQKRPRLRWADGFNLWGPLTYRVLVDGAAVGDSARPELIPSVDVRDGVHRWQVVGIDRRGQTVTSRSRTLRVDATLPQLTVRVSGSRKARRTLKFRIRAEDPSNPVPSGMRAVRADFGDGVRIARRSARQRPARRSARRRPVARTTALSTTLGHAYRRPGTYTVRVTAIDRAGNRAVFERRLRIGR